MRSLHKFGSAIFSLDWLYPQKHHSLQIPAMTAATFVNSCEPSVPVCRIRLAGFRGSKKKPPLIMPREKFRECGIVAAHQQMDG
jgi:hypothetical protein